MSRIIGRGLRDTFDLRPKNRTQFDSDLSSSGDSSSNQNPGYTPDDMDGNGELQASNIARTDENHVHVSFPETIPKPGTSNEIMSNGPSSHGSEIYFQTPDSNIYYRTTGITRMKEVETNGKEERKCRLSWLKFALITFVILGGIVGIIILVTQLRNPTPPAETQKLVGTTPTPTFWCSPEVEISLRDRIVINCSLKNVQPKEVTIRVTPPSYYTAGSQPVNLTLSTLDLTSNLTWAMVKQPSSASDVQLYGPLAMCNSSGIYQIQISNNEQILQREEVKINISRNITKVEFTLNRASDASNNTNTTNSNGTQSSNYNVACSTQSGCDASSLGFLGILDNDQEQMIYGMDFACTINYTNSYGWSVNCTGTIPEAIANQMKKIVCRQFSNQLTKEEQQQVDSTIKLVDCDIKNNCGYTCKEGDYYAVDQNRCDIYHRCYNLVAYTQYCPENTFFVNEICSCQHKRDVQPGLCRSDGARLKQENTAVCKSS